MIIQWIWGTLLSNKPIYGPSKLENLRRLRGISSFFITPLGAPALSRGAAGCRVSRKPCGSPSNLRWATAVLVPAGTGSKLWHPSIAKRKSSKIRLLKNAKRLPGLAKSAWIPCHRLHLEEPRRLCTGNVLQHQNGRAVAPRAPSLTAIMVGLIYDKIYHPININ